MRIASSSKGEAAMICETSQAPIRAATPTAGAGLAPQLHRVLGMPEMARATLSDRPATSRLQGPHSRPARERLPLPSQSNWTRRSYVLSGHPFPRADSAQAIEQRGTNDLLLVWRRGHGDDSARRKPWATPPSEGLSSSGCSHPTFVSNPVSAAQSRRKDPDIGRSQPRLYFLLPLQSCGLSSNRDKPSMTFADAPLFAERPIQKITRRPV